MAELATEYDPIRGPLALGTFGEAPGDANVAVGGRNLREGLMASLISAELMAGFAGVVPLIQLPGGQRGVGVLGGAREKIAQADPTIRTIYLAAHGAARQAQAHARNAGGAPRIDGTLAALQGWQPVQIGDFGATAIVITVIGVAAAIATAWFAKGVIEKIIETHGKDLRASYVADTAAKLATAQIAAGQPVDPGLVDLLKGVATEEQRDAWLVPTIAVGGGVAVVGGLGYLAWQKWGHHVA